MNIDQEKHKDAVKIDAMFFTSTEEPVVLHGKANPSGQNEADFHQLDNSSQPSVGKENSNNSKDQPSALFKHERRYLDMDTFILCNPNAMSY
jgi:hypothetical protein